MHYTVPEILNTFILKHYNYYKAMNDVTHAYNEQNPNKFHLEGSIWTHTCMVLKEAENESTVMKLSALCHDLGKPFVYIDKPETLRRRFSSHEAKSVFCTIDVLKSFDLDLDTRNRIIFVVANHGSLYNYFKSGTIPESNYEKVMAKFTYLEFKDLTEFYRCDHEGRFYEDVERDEDSNIYDAFNNILALMKTRDANPITEMISSKTLTVLIGPPRVGKSTWVKKNVQNEEIISRDWYVEEIGTGETYNEKWHSLSQEQNKEIDALIQSDFRNAIKLGHSVIVDMTNMSKKSRKKWINNASNYFVKAIVFLESPECLLSRNTPMKAISQEVSHIMQKNFVWPLRDEVDTVELICG